MPAHATPAPTATADPQKKVNVGVDPALSAAGKPRALGAVWLAYALQLVTAQAAASKLGMTIDHSAAEVAARTLLAQQWKAGRKDEHDPYLDALVSVLDAGFMHEYVVAYLAAPGWHLSADQLKALRLDAFRDWRAKQLPDHHAETHARATFGTPDPAPPGAELLDGITFRTLADCAIAPELRRRLDKWEAANGAIAGVRLVVSNRDERVDSCSTTSCARRCSPTA